MMLSATALSLERVSVIYVDAQAQQERVALDQVSFTLARGSWTAVIGANGSGKSTLAKAAAGLSPISEGAVQLGSGHSVSIVMQNPETQLLGETVREEFMLSLPAGHTAADGMNPGAGLDKLLRACLASCGLDVTPDFPVKKLTGGQKQLLHIACCAATGTSVMIFDESTSMLDPASRRKVLEAAARLHRQGITLLWITHRPEELPYAGRVIALDQGKLAYDGGVEAFFYGGPAEPSPCGQLGFVPPYTVQVAQELLQLGIALPAQPLFPHQLSESVGALCRL